MTETIQGGASTFEPTKKSNEQIKNENKLNRVNIPEMIKHMPFLTEKKIVDVLTSTKKIKIPKESRVPSMRGNDLKPHMKNLAEFVKNNDISEFKKEEINNIRKNKFKNVFQTLALDTPEWDKAIIITSEDFRKK